MSKVIATATLALPGQGTGLWSIARPTLLVGDAWIEGAGPCESKRVLARRVARRERLAYTGSVQAIRRRRRGSSEGGRTCRSE
jgi:hypothetical protein